MYSISKLLLAGLFVGLLCGTQPACAQPRPDYCSPAGRTSSLVLIDRTSPYTRTGEDHQGQRIAAGIDAIFSSLNTGDRLSIATIERHRALSSIVFDSCFPGCDLRQRSPLPFSDCPEATIELRRRNFRSELYAAVYPLLENTTDQPNSDIAGTIYQTVQQHPYSRVYLFGDMLENSAILPWARFSSQPPEENFAVVRNNGFVPSLRGASIQVVGFGLLFTHHHPPLTEAQDRNIREFWRLYFGAGGATISYRSAIEP